MIERVDRGRLRARAPSMGGRFTTGHATRFGVVDAAPFDDWADGGGYPRGFLPWAYERLGVDTLQAARYVLHVCSGSLRTGITVDVRADVGARVVADARALPFRDATFRHVMIDPPYAEDYARTLYGTEAVYPSPAALVREASRVLAAGGRLGFLHFLVPPLDPGVWSLVAVHGITIGPGYAIRAFTVLERTAAPCVARARPRTVTRGELCACGCGVELDHGSAGGAFRTGRPRRYATAACRSRAFRSRSTSPARVTST